MAVVRRPSLWFEGLRAVVAMAPRGWWRRSPYLPLPDEDYAAWRLATAHGDAAVPLEPRELIRYLEWRKRQHGLLRRV